MVNAYILHKGLVALKYRVCACIGLFGGIDLATVARLLDVPGAEVRRCVPALVSSGCLSRYRHGNSRRYHLLSEGRRLVREEEARINAEMLAVLGSVASSGRAKMDKVAILERALRGG